MENHPVEPRSGTIKTSVCKVRDGNAPKLRGFSIEGVKAAWRFDGRWEIDARWVEPGSRLRVAVGLMNYGQKEIRVESFLAAAGGRVVKTPFSDTRVPPTETRQIVDFEWFPTASDLHFSITTR
jgi:hypothetical protein